MAHRLVLNAKLDTSCAGQLRDELVAVHGQDVVLDASGVEHLGALCTEVLLSARHLWLQKKASISVENASHHLMDNLGRMGLSISDISTGETV